LDPAQPRRDAVLEGALNVIVVEYVERTRQSGTSVLAHGLCVRGVTQPKTEALAYARMAQLLGDHLARQEVLLHELAEAPAELSLAGLDDRGVGDGQAQRMAKKRRDGE